MNQATVRAATPGGWPPSERVVLCLGSGGVGKTTVSAALAMALARRGERVVVLTIDPARRLADALGLAETLGNEPRRIPIAEAGPGEPASGQSGELWATMLDPSETFESVVRAEAPTPEQADRILANPLFRNLTRTLSGTNEYMAAERLHQLYHDDRFDRVVVDTPPSRHALDFLDSPGQLNRFINHRLYRSVFAPRGLLRTVSVGGQLALRLLGRIVGSRLVDDVVTFFANFEGLDAGFERRSREIEEVLLQRTSFVLVTSARRQPLDEASWIASNVARRRGGDSAIDAVIVNRACPVDPDVHTRIDGDPSLAAGGEALGRNLQQLSSLAAQERDLVDGFLADLAPAPSTVIRLTERYRPISELASLADLAAELESEVGI